MKERVALGYRCSHCQRPLPLRRTGIVACGACGGENYVELPPGALPNDGSRAFAVILMGVVGLLTLTLIAGGAAAFFVLRRPAPSAPEPLDPAPAIPPMPGGRKLPPSRSTRNASDIVSWVGGGAGTGPLVVDVGGSTVVVGFAASNGLTAIRSASGEIVWENAALTSEHGALHSDGRGGLVLTNRKDFKVRGVDPLTGVERWAVRLPDAPESVAFGEGCLVATAIDRSRTDLSLAAGTPAPCPGTRPVKKPWEEAQAPLEVGGLQITFHTLAVGSPRIVVTATRGGAKAWEDTLSIAFEPIGPARHALSKAGLVVAGSVPGAQAMGVVLIEPSTGKVIVSREIEQKQSHGTFFVHLAASDDTVFLETFGKLYALGLPELDPRWVAGSMW
jgi:hypothetical protein